jgi:hypothetical protein
MARPPQRRKLPKGFLKWLYKVLKGCGFFVGHIIYAAVALGGIQIIRWLVGHTAEDYLLFDRLPLRYVFHFMDLVVLLIIVAWAVWDGIKHMRDDDDDDL